MKILVCGGRDFKDEKLLHDTLIKYMDWDLHIIEGGARGADRLASDWAKYYGVYTKRFPAFWSVYGKSAGMIRNKQMLVEGKPDLVIAFPGGKGTANMVKLAQQAGIEVIKIDFKNIDT